MADQGYDSKVRRLGIPDKVVEHGTQKELYNLCGYDTVAIISAAREMVKEKVL